MCDCVFKTSEAIIKKKEDDSKGIGIIGEGNFTHMGLSFGKNSGWRTYQEFEYEFTPIKKNGEHGRQVKKRVSMYHTYCPFCGKKYKN